MNTNQRRLLLCGLAPAGFVGVLLIQGAVRPGYDALHHFGSELSLGPAGWIQVTNFLATGVLTICYAFGLRHTLAGGRGAIAAPILVGIWGLSLVVAGIFPTDPKPGYPPGVTGTVDATTVAGKIHDANALPSFAILTAAIFVFAARLAADRRWVWMWATLLTGVIAPVTFMLSGVLFEQAARAGTLYSSYHGLAQRITITLGFGWLSAIALLLLRRPITKSQEASL